LSFSVVVELGDQVHGKHPVGSLIHCGKREVEADHRLQPFHDRAAAGDHDDAEQGAQPLLYGGGFGVTPLPCCCDHLHGFVGVEILERFDHRGKVDGYWTVLYLRRVKGADAAAVELQLGPERGLSCGGIEQGKRLLFQHQGEIYLLPVLKRIGVGDLQSLVHPATPLSVHVIKALVKYSTLRTDWPFSTSGNGMTLPGLMGSDLSRE